MLCVRHTPTAQGSGSWPSQPRTRRNLPRCRRPRKSQPMSGAFLCRKTAKGQRPSARGRPAAPPKKIGKKVPGSFDFAIWHGIVVSCSGKATRVNTTSPHSPNPHRRDSKRVKPVPVSLLRRVLAAFPGHSTSFNSKSPPNRNDLGGLRSVLGAKR